MPLRVVLRSGRERSVARRHPWVFSGSIHSVEGEDPLGRCDLFSTDGRLLGRGLWSPNASLSVRLLVFGEGPALDAHLFAGRFQAAQALRDRVLPPDTSGYRLVHAEGDGLPGLVVDLFGDVAVVQATTAGVEAARPLWLPPLREALGGRTIVQRNGLPVRRQEGLPLDDEVLQGALPGEPVPYTEHGRLLLAEVPGGQKTGSYLDQRENRERVGALCQGRRVLDLYAHAGGFGLAALAHGATRALEVDASDRALDLAREVRRRNGFPAPEEDFVRADVPADLRARVQRGERWDVVVLDPPPFARRRDDLDAALRAYKDVNRLAMALVAPGGMLLTCTCSGAVDPGLFQKVVFGASVDAGVPLRLLERRGAGPDHPVSLDCPEGEYLVGLLLQREGASPT